MQVVIQPNAGAAADLAAHTIAEAICQRPNLVLGLATGSTMEAVYARLRVLRRDDALDFSACRTFNLDEYVGLPGSHVNSYRFYMNHQLFNHVNINLSNTHVPNGTAVNLDAECRAYEVLIQQAGGIDLQLLGIGRTGHIGFNEPMSPFNSRTRVERLVEATLKQNAPHFKNPEDMPRQAITMGVGTIMGSRRCLLLATGVEKAEILARALEGPITINVPASVLQLHPHCTVIADEAAASCLKKQTAHQTPEVARASR